ncbi:hypothetical protein Y032_0097g3009 [Ancylostoma ceylanicum]|nr:hypothetical protein Y032_0097g3009 [Ancylostoma ceylanicum]
MIVCGVKLVRQLRKVAMSAKTISVQKQLLKALITQAIIPFFMSYTPRFLMFFFVIMGYPPLRIYSFVPLIVTMYTVLDPIAITFFIHEYREAVVRMVKRLIFFNHVGNTHNMSRPHTQTVDIRSTSFGP